MHSLRRPAKFALPCCLLGCLLHLAPVARADVDLKFQGSISSDIRYRFLGEPRYDAGTPTQWELLHNGFSRNENRIRAALNVAFGTKVKAVADAELLLFGFSDLNDLDSTTLRDRVDPWNLEIHAAYIDINNILPHLDLRVGRQIVPWGAADKFNPVSNVNTLDLSDPLLFGRALANNMIRLDYNPIGDLTFTAVAIPIFRPAQLPRSAPIALLDPLRPPPILDQGIRRALDNDRQVYLSPINHLSVVADVLQPEISFANAQFAFRAAAKALGQDLALSYYHGRFGIPTTAWVVTTGTFANSIANSQVVYPRTDVLGIEAAGTIEKLGGVGWWAEAAVNFPQEITLGIYESVSTGTLVGREYVRRAGQDPSCDSSPKGCDYMGIPRTVDLDHGGREVPRPVIVPSTPFVKATLGADYAIGHVYLNVQYVHGFIDEFGAGRIARPRRNSTDLNEQPRVESRIGDYMVGGLDLKLLADRLLLRLFAAIKVPSYDAPSKLWDDYAFTAVIFPQILWTVWDATELTIGSFILLGDRTTKFGDPAAGASEVFAKAKISF